MALPTEKPKPYVVYWQDWALCARIARDEGIADEDVEPDRFERSRDFATLAAARAFFRTKEQYGASLERRDNFRMVHDPPLSWWNWDQEPVPDAAQDDRGGA